MPSGPKKKKKRLEKLKVALKGLMGNGVLNFFVLLIKLDNAIIYMSEQIWELLGGKSDSSMWDPNWFPCRGRVLSGKTAGIGLQHSRAVSSWTSPGISLKLRCLVCFCKSKKTQKTNTKEPLQKHFGNCKNTAQMKGFRENTVRLTENP